MKSLFALLTVATLLSSHVCGQVPRYTPEEEQLLEKLKQEALRVKKRQTVLRTFSLNVGVLGRFSDINAKVFQVIDGNTMLVGLKDSFTFVDDSERLRVMIKCPTKGIVDGHYWDGKGWQEVAGTDVLTVTGTTTYRTVLGATRTVFVIEPAKEEKPLELTEKEKQLKEDLLKREAQAAKESAKNKALEAMATRELQLARKLEGRGFDSALMERYEKIIKHYPDTVAAAQAKVLLEKLKP